MIKAMKGQMAMSLLDGLKRQKKKHIREQLLDAPTLFAGVGNDSQNTEKKISVLSAAGGKQARRARQRRAPERSGPMIRPFYVALLIGTIALAGIWQTGVLDRNVAITLAAQFDSLLRAGASALDPSDDPASARAVGAKSSMAELRPSLDTGSENGRHAERPASIERVALANSGESRASGQPIPALDPIEAALNRTDPVAESVQPAAPPRPAAKKAPVATTSAAASKRVSSVAPSVSAQPVTDKVVPEKTSERKVQVARSKEPDADAQLMEALLLHLKKTESAKGGTR